LEADTEDYYANYSEIRRLKLDTDSESAYVNLEEIQRTVNVQKPVVRQTYENVDDIRRAVHVVPQTDDTDAVSIQHFDNILWSLLAYFKVIVMLGCWKLYMICQTV